MPKKTFLRLDAEKQERVIRSAIGEFNKNGFERTRIEDIAAGAGVAKGSIYQYFEDKKDLYIYCAEWGLAVFMKKLDGYAPTSDMDIFEYFADTLTKIRVMQEEKDLIAFLSLMTQEPGLAEASMAGMYQVGDEYIVRLIANSKRKGSVRRDIDDEILKEYFIGITDRFERRWMSRYLDFSREIPPEQNEMVQKELAQMLELIKNGRG